MASTTAMYTALSGLNASSRSLDVIGNNIANVNTTAFKSSRVQLSDNFYRTLRGASAPSDVSGGSNPSQIGLGVQIAGVARSFEQGGVSVTGDSGDLAIEGAGFFAVNRSDTRYFTRAGNFRLDAQNHLTTPTGDILQGYLADDDFNIPTSGTLTAISIPLGSRAVAQATTRAGLFGNLNSSGTVASSGSVTTIGGTATAGLRVVTGATPTPGTGEQILATSLLTDIEDPATAIGSGTRLFSAGQIIEIRDARRGSAALPTQQFTITATSTVDDLNTFLTTTLGIQTGANNPDGSTPGVTIDPVTGNVRVVGNVGTVNALAIGSSAIRLLDSAGVFVRSPLVSTATSTANGESVRTQFQAFDSLGNEVNVNVSMVLLSKNATGGTTWGYSVDSPDDADPTTVMGSGTIAFDDQGRLVDTTPISVSLERNGTGGTTGSASPLAFEINLSDGNSQVTSLATASQLLPANIDGLPPGTLQDFAVDRDGTIYGSFSNSAVRAIGRIPLATFVNPAGLTEQGSNLFQASSNSGAVSFITAGANGSGSIVERSLELSNVDLSQQFIDLITASTAFSASSRIITTTDQLFQQLLALGR